MERGAANGSGSDGRNAPALPPRRAGGGRRRRVGWAAATGWIAAAFTFGAYSMKTMLPLRAFAVLANLFFIAFSLTAQIYPTLALHVLLLPLNAARLVQVARSALAARRARGLPDEPLAVLLPHMSPLRVRAGDVVFRAGEVPDRLYVVVEGTVVIEERGVRLGSGALFGEIAFFSSRRARTATARCEIDGRLLAIDEAGFVKLLYQHPAVGLYLVRLVTDRLLEREPAAPGSEAPTDAAAPGGTPENRA